MTEIARVATVLFVPALGLLALGSGYAWWRCARTGFLAQQPARAAPWGLFDLLLTFSLLVSFQSLTRMLLSRGGIPPQAALETLSVHQQLTVIFAGGSVSLVVLLLSAVLITVRTGARLRDFGVQPRRIAGDIRLGAVAFVMLAPIVFTIQALLVQVFESRHPLLEMLKNNPDPRFLAASVFSAVIVAPLVEEYLFRLLLLGWLERLPGDAGHAGRVFLGGAQGDGEGAEERTRTGETEPVSQQGPEAQPEPEASRRDQSDLAPPPFWPVILSALLFAAMHAQHGPDPIPLFVLAIGLGYLYQRTRRILPCIVLHLLLNAFSIGVLWMVLFSETPTEPPAAAP